MNRTTQTFTTRATLPPKQEQPFRQPAPVRPVQQQQQQGYCPVAVSQMKLMVRDL